MARKYSKKSQQSVKRAMHKYKRGELKSGRGGHASVKSRKQAIAIGLSEARKKGAKVPKKATGRKKSTKSRSTSARRKTTKRTTRSRK